MTSTPRAVVITRPTPYEELIARHATRQQVEFFTTQRGQSLARIDAIHRNTAAAVTKVSQAIPVSWRRSRVSREDLSRFVFEPADIIIIVGQDGLVANVAKYLDGQPVIGVNPDRATYDGVLVPHRAKDLPRLLKAIASGRHEIESRCMATAVLDDGQTLHALNEVFIGHRSHQSARYDIHWRDASEAQSSSGIVVSTGTGASGWARSISLQRKAPPVLPSPTTANLTFFVRETFPSVDTTTVIQDGTLLADEPLTITSRMNHGGVIFGDGIEDDRMAFEWGMTASISVSKRCLALVR